MIKFDCKLYWITGRERRPTHLRLSPSLAATGGRYALIAIPYVALLVFLFNSYKLGTLSKPAILLIGLAGLLLIPLLLSLLL